MVVEKHKMILSGTLMLKSAPGALYFLMPVEQPWFLTLTNAGPCGACVYGSML